MATTPTRLLMYGRKHQTGVNWITAIAMIGFHIGAVAALFYIDLGAMLAAVVLWIMAGSFGIGMGYHRLLTHRSYKTPKAVEFREALPKSTVGKLLRRVLVEEERAKAEARPQS